MTDRENTDNVIEGTATENNSETQTQKKEPFISKEVLSRIFMTLLFALIGWFSLWVFGFAVVVQCGFLLITGNLNKNLKTFNGKLGNYLADIFSFVSFNKDEKPFPFQSWNYEDKTTKDGVTVE